MPQPLTLAKFFNYALFVMKLIPLSPLYWGRRDIPQVWSGRDRTRSLFRCYTISLSG